MFRNLLGFATVFLRTFQARVGFAFEQWFVFSRNGICFENDGRSFSYIDMDMDTASDNHPRLLVEPGDPTPLGGK